MPGLCLRSVNPIGWPSTAAGFFFIFVEVAMMIGR